MTELSPAAQAVVAAYRADWQDEYLKQDVGCLAAALRAAALYCKRDAAILLAIADELEGE
jgi:hypothetical protein